MRDLLESLDRITEAPRGEKGGGDASNIQAKPKPEDPRTVTNKKFGSIGDFIKAVRTPGQQGGSTAAQTRANLAKATAPKAPAAPKAAAPMPADQASALGTQAIAKAPAPAPTMAMPKSPPAKTKQRAKVAATAANTKDFDKTMALQKRLRAQGADIKADGIMGPNTRAAMKQFGGGKPAGTTAQQTGGAGGEFGTAPAASTQVASPGPRGRNRPRNRPAPAEPTPARGGVLARIGAGVRDFFGGGDRKPSPGRGGRGRGQKPPTAVAQAPAQDAPQPINVGGRNAPQKAAGPNAPGSNFATAADGSISRTDTPRQPGEPLPRGSRRNRRTAPVAAPTQSARRGDDRQQTPTTQTAMVSPERGTIPGQGPATRTVRQRVTDPDEKAAIMRQINTARERQRLALAAGSTDPDDIRAYQRRMANTRGTGAAGGTDPNTF